jgi:hypothetical protein
MMFLKFMVVILTFISVGLWIDKKFQKGNEVPFFSFKFVKAFGGWIVALNVGFIIMFVVVVMSGVGGNWDNDHAPNPNDTAHMTPKQEYDAEMKAKKAAMEQERTDMENYCNTLGNDDSYKICMSQIDDDIKADFPELNN